MPVSTEFRYIMPDYTPPISSHLICLTKLCDIEDALSASDLDMGTVEAILEEASKLARDVLAPLNQVGDNEGCVLKDGAVSTPKGFKEAYAQYRDSGWNSVPFDPDFGGQGLPWSVAFCIQEMWQGANMSFGLCPLLNQGAVDALHAHGSEAQKAYYLPKLISGEWTGTMNLTEPQAGSDLAAIKAQAVPDGDAYKITGQKIFITYGEHDFTDNIIHLVLARLLDAPEGVKGISLFVVPKFLEDGSRNDVICTGIEHKLGIHASPTCTMQFGDKGGATGWLVGEAHAGLKYMFTMMNNARLSVGLQGVAIAERATQAAETYARERVQGRSFDSEDRVTIIHHPDVKRMVDEMKAMTLAGRAMTLYAAGYLDKARSGDATAQTAVDLLVPIVKAWCTDMAVHVASMGVQVHGGMGFIEETGAAQFYRDARILPVYEGTNGIQAGDLVFRKILRDQGVAATSFLQNIDTDSSLIKNAINYILKLKPEDSALVSVPFLQGFGTWLGGVLLHKLGAEEATFYDRFILPRAEAELKAVSK